MISKRLFNFLYVFTIWNGVIISRHVKKEGINRHDKPCSRSSGNGDCQSKWPEQAGTVVLDQPEVISTEFDCGNKLYKSKGDHVFTLTKGASLSNCYFEQSGTDDAVHVEGAGRFTLKNLYFLSTGDDGISIKGDADVDVIGGGFLKAGNKAVQHDGTGQVTIQDGCFENVHILAKSCGNCEQNAYVKGRIINIKDCTISNVRTVCGVNTNRDDVCTVTGLVGTPVESVCTGYDAITNPKIHEPPQTSKNQKNEHCVF